MAISVPVEETVQTYPSVRHNSFDTLQVGRALAAIAVVFFHAHVFFIPERLYPGLSISRIFDIGYSGVEFFFVLSGFIMMLVHQRDIGIPQQAAVFFKKRFVRIVPFYWVVLFVLIVLLSAQWPESADRLSLETVLYSVVLLPQPSGEPLLIGAAWTLSQEFLFYLIFGLCIWRLAVGLPVMLIWFGTTVLLLLNQPLPYLPNFIFSPYNLLFGMGIIAALIFRHIPLAIAVSGAVVGMVGFLAVGLSDAYGITSHSHATRTILFGMAALIAIAGLAAWEETRRMHVPPSLVFLGNASFSIYLVHGIVLPVATKGLIVLNASAVLPPIAGLSVLVLLSVLIGSLAHIYVERPLIRALRPKSPTAQREP